MHTPARTKSLKERFGKELDISRLADRVQGHHRLGTNGAGRSRHDRHHEDDNLKDSARRHGTAAARGGGGASGNCCCCCTAILVVAASPHGS
jgi:hypothetical protein